MSQAIDIALLGLGVVGSGVARVLADKAADIAQTVGRPIRVKRALVRHPDRRRDCPIDPSILTTDVGDIIGDPDVAIVVELMGGEQPAYDYARRAIDAGKHVVTANKEVIAKFGPELFSLARAHHVDVSYEASVGGGIPLIAPFRQTMVANRVNRIRAIINGTTNFILTKMAQEGTAFATALRQAQDLGYAEADPRNDVDGVDAAYKIAILSALAFRSVVRPHQVYREGISRLHPNDFRYARELGYTIKLLAIARQDVGVVEARVHPTLIPEHVLLAQVDGVFNAVEVEGDLTGRVMFYGRGAGSDPTAAAVVADVIDLAHNLRLGIANRLEEAYDPSRRVRTIADVVTRHYLRLQVADRPGVLAQIASVLGENQISIASVMQKESDETAQTAEIVIMTHAALEAAMQAALGSLERLPSVRELSNFIRVES